MRCWRSIRDTDKVERIDVGGSPHWIAFSHTTASCLPRSRPRKRSRWSILDSRRVTGTIPIPHGAEGIAVSPDGETLFVCAHRKGVVHVIDTRTMRFGKRLPSPARRARPTSSAACGCRRTAAMSARPRMSTISPPSTRPTRSSRSAASPRRRRPWASASPPTAATLICAATTPPSTLEFELDERPHHAAISDRGRLRVLSYDFVPTRPRERLAQEPRALQPVAPRLLRPPC